jgi:phosphoribosylamine--glycine ligase
VPEGYPDKPIKNAEIDISHVLRSEQLYLGAVDLVNNKLVETGSRTAAVVGVAETITAAEKYAEEDINRITGPLFHREDIGTEQLIRKRVEQMNKLRG